MKKKKKSFVPLPPHYGPEELGLELPNYSKDSSTSEDYILPSKKQHKFPGSKIKKQLPEEDLPEPYLSELPEELPSEQNFPDHRFGLPNLPSETEMSGKKHIQEMLKQNPEKPIFIKVENFKEIVENILSIEKKIEELEQIISKLQETKQDEETKLDSWYQDLQEIKEKLDVLEKDFSSKL